MTNSSNHNERSAISLIELLVVMAVVALLAGILLPAIGNTRRHARELQCLSNLRAVQTGMLMYAAANDDCIIPSYNMQGITGHRANPLDGWAPLLDQAGLVVGNQTMEGHPFVCPLTDDFPGLAVTNRGVSHDSPTGYMDWPALITFANVSATTIPERGLKKIIRTSYWINAENPIGAPRPIEPGIHYTASVGYGPDPSGITMPLTRLHQIKTPARLIALADGIYAGNQYAVRPGDTGLRIGYRHGSNRQWANTSFADGHVESLAAANFPRKDHPGLTPAQREEVHRQNLGTGPTVYANPEKSLANHP